MLFIVILLLILLNSYFSLAEIALVAVKKAQLEAAADAGSKAAVRALQLVRAPEAFLSAVQVGITLLSLVEGIYGGDLVATRLEPVLRKAGLQPWLAHALSLVLGIGLITYFTIVIGELLPKSIALQAPLKITLAIAPSLVAFSRIAYPFIRLLTGSTRILLRALRIRTGEKEHITDQDLLRMLSTAYQQGVLEQEELWLHQNIFAFGHLTAGRMMKPLGLVRCLDAAWDEEAVVRFMRRYAYSRFPVCAGPDTRITGVLSVKQFFMGKEEPWPQRAQAPLYVPAAMDAADVFTRFVDTHSDFAVVTDGDSRPVGIITMQDIMESVFGDIPEPETYSAYFFKVKDKEWQSHGFIHLQRIRRVLGLPWLRAFETSYLSLQELLTGELGQVPAPGATLTLHDVTFEVAAVEENVIKRVMIRLP